MQKSSNKDRTNKLHEACFHSRQKRVCGDCGPALDGNAYIREISKRNALKEIKNEIQEDDLAEYEDEQAGFWN